MSKFRTTSVHWKFWHFHMALSWSKLAWLRPNLGILWLSLCSFLLCGLRVANPIIYRLVPTCSPSQYEIWQWSNYWSEYYNMEWRHRGLADSTLDPALSGLSSKHGQAGSLCCILRWDALLLHCCSRPSQMCRWVPANLMQGVMNYHPTWEGGNTLSNLILQTPE